MQFLQNLNEAIFKMLQPAKKYLSWKNSAPNKLHQYSENSQLRQNIYCQYLESSE